MEFKEKVAGEVRAHMARHRQTGRSLARELGWSEMYLSNRLTGKVALDVEDLAAIAAILDVPVTAFLEVPGGFRRPGCLPFSQPLAVAA